MFQQMQAMAQKQVSPFSLPFSHFPALFFCSSVVSLLPPETGGPKNKIIDEKSTLSLSIFRLRQTML